MEDIRTWSKRVLVLAIIVGVGFGGWKLFGPRIQNYIHNAEVVTTPHDKYDPTKDATADPDDVAQKNGKQAFTSHAK
jgi:hypothetical protein